MNNKINILFVLLALVISNVKAQSVAPPEDAYLSLELIHPVDVPDSLLISSFDPMSMLSNADSLLISANMILSDTNNTNKIHIKMGTTLGGNDLIDQVINYDDTTLVAPQVYLRELNHIKICFGSYSNTGTFYCEIKLEDHLGNFSTLINCQSAQ